MLRNLAGAASCGLRTGLILCLMSLLAACGPGNAVGVQYHGYTIALSRPSMKAGTIIFNMNNQDGQVLHEFVVVQTELAADKLPMGSNSKVDETGLTIVGRVDKVDVGQSGTLTANLAAGHYVLMCNIVGHYQLGMHTDFTVTP